MTKLTFITGNPHKAEMYSRLLDYDLEHQKIDLIEIQSRSIEEVALHKINQAYEAVGRPVIIDDFGFCMEGLDNLPGPFTKFFADSEAGLAKLCRIADILPNRRAKVVCAIAYQDSQGSRVFVGELLGEVADQPRGDIGIDTDRIFMPDGYHGKTRAELTSDDYDQVYLDVRPVNELKKFLDQRSI